MKRSNQNNSHNEGIRIVKAAAFCFAVVSWYATARGLQEYVFIGQYWQALMISFGIQSILFVFNLKLPNYFDRIGERIPEEFRKHRKYHTWKRRGESKSTFRWSFLQKLIALFYVIVLLASSFFSFVYMTNLVYKNTQYIDANVILDRKYRMYLNEIDVYSNEFAKVSQLTINSKLAKLQELTKGSNSGDQKSKSDLENILIEKQKEYNIKSAEQKAAQSRFETAKGTYETPMNVRWRSSQVYAEEKEEYDTARKDLEQVGTEVATAKSEVDKAQLELDNYRPTLNTTVHDLLVKTLDPEFVSDDLNSLMTDLNNMVIGIGENQTSTSVFAQIVLISKELSIAIENYEALKSVQSQKGDNNDIADFKKQLLNDEIIVPVPSSESFLDDKKQWEVKWKDRFQSMETVIKSVPKCSESAFIGIDGISEIVDIESLKEFNAQKISDEIDVIVRGNLAHINALERAVKLLFSTFPALAWFSLAIAVFFDISSLLAGLFIYLTSPDTKSKEKQDVSISQN